MTISYRILKSYNIFYLRFEGEITLSDINQARPLALSDPDFTPELAQLVDLRFAQATSFPLSHIRALAETSAFQRGVKRALVAPTDIEFGLSRMFEVFNEPQHQLVQVFRSLEDACEWLGVPVDALQD